VDNAIATQEITYYERIAKETGATIMLLHHTNKVSRDGSTSGAQSFRGATALFDSIRAVWYRRGCTETKLMAMVVEDRTPGRYLVWENSKNNQQHRQH